VVIVEDLKLSAPKTKDFSVMLGSVQQGARKSLFVVPEYDANVYLSSRNLSGNKTMVLSDMNTYDLVNAQVVIFTESAAKLFSEPVAAEA
jgi:large subunit ribosomal protein L4